MLALAVTLAGCETQSPAAPAPESLAATSPASYLSVSEDSPDVGSVVTIAGNADRAHGGQAFGSFGAHMTYDQARLEYVGEAPLPGAMRAINAVAGRVTVAGAAASGFTDGKLFAVRFKVLKARPFESLALVMDELNGVDYASQLRALTSRSVRQLDRSLK